MPPLLLKLLFTLMPKRAPALLRPLVRKVIQPGADRAGQSAAQAAHGFLGSELGKSEWFAGSEFTAADIQMSFPLEAAAARGGLEQAIPRRWRSSNASTRARPMPERWKRAGRTRWDGRQCLTLRCHSGAAHSVESGRSRYSGSGPADHPAMTEIVVIAAAPPRSLPSPAAPVRGCRRSDRRCRRGAPRRDAATA